VPDPIACARGCTVRDRHLSTCPEQDPAWPECTGCQPRGAETGQLCGLCLGRITRALLDAPHLVRWLRANVAPGAPADAPRVTLTREAPAPLSIAAVDDIDAVFAALANGITRYCGATGLTGPRLTGARAVADTNGGSRVNGVRSDVPDAQAVGQLAAWALDHLDGIVSQTWAPTWHDDVTVIVRTANKRWPRHDPARKLPIPCPSCDRVMLFMHPPVAAGHPTTVTCHASDCARVLTEADYWLRAQTLYSERARMARP
jgi:hypothetical protein